MFLKVGTRICTKVHEVFGPPPRGPQRTPWGPKDLPKISSGDKLYIYIYIQTPDQKKTQSGRYSYGIICMMESLYGFLSWTYIAELYYGTVLETYITEWPCENEPVDPREVPGAPWELHGTAGTSRGSPRTPRDPPQTTKPAISPQMYGARRS